MSYTKLENQLYFKIVESMFREKQETFDLLEHFFNRFSLHDLHELKILCFEMAGSIEKVNSKRAKLESDKAAVRLLSRAPRRSRGRSDIISSEAASEIITMFVDCENEDRTHRIFALAVCAFCYLSDSKRNLLLSEIERLVLSVDSEAGHSVCELAAALDEVKVHFDLDVIDVDILVFKYLIDSDQKLEISLDGIYKTFNHKPSFIRAVSEMFNHPKELVSSRLSPKSNLYKNQILINDRSYRGGIEINIFIKDYLNQPDEDGLFSSFKQNKKIEVYLKTSEFKFDAQEVKIMKNLLFFSKKPILLFGPPGTGKTEFAKALQKELATGGFILTQSNEDGEESLNHRKMGLIAIKNSGGNTNRIIIVDEADNLLQTRNYWSSSRFKTDHKAWLNDYLENDNLPQIWITNDISQIDSSTLRRFSYIKEFTEIGTEERVKNFRRLLHQFGIKGIRKKIITELVTTYKLEVGDYARAIEDIAKMGTHLKPKDFVSMCELIFDNKVDCYGEKVKKVESLDNYDPNALNTNIAPQTIIESLNRFAKSESFLKNYNLLFEGPPGTGKSEFAQHLAHALGKELILKKASDLLSKYVGESEENIARAFRQSEARGAILFIDEADSFFINRQSAYRSWEVTQVNELLNCMERFKGILICATNFRDKFDPAALRRFSVKVEFKPLTGKGNILMAENWFEKKLNIKLGDEIQKFASLTHLTPGDFKTVAYKNAFNKGVSVESLLADLRNEVSYKKESKKVGLSV